MDYIVAGYSMVTDIYYPDGSCIKESPGGSYYSAAGIKLWRDSVVYLGTAGPDFERYYGAYFKANGIQTAVKTCLPNTLYYNLNYREDGSWFESCKYGEDYERFAQKEGRLTPAMFAACCDAQTKGIYLEASLAADIADHLAELKALLPNGKLMWEINTEDLLNPAAHEKIRTRIAQVDIFSMNLHEARGFFGVTDEADIIRALLAIGKPCFLRMGARGAALLADGSYTFVPAVGVDRCVDTTGCGNCSTAAALIGFAEGLPPAETVAMANISAAYNVRQIGPYPLVDEAVRAEASDTLTQLLDNLSR